MFNIDKFVEDNEISISTSMVEYNPFIPHEASDMKHCFCKLTGETLSNFEFYLSYVDTVEGYTPDASFAIERLLDDVKTFRNCDGYDDFARLLGIEDDDPSGIVAFEEAGRLSKLVDQHFTLDVDIAATPAL